jgi:hypothetical protein
VFAELRRTLVHVGINLLEDSPGECLTEFVRDGPL